MDLTINQELIEKIENIRLGMVTARIQNSAYQEDLWQEIMQTIENLRSEYTLENVKNRIQIAATKSAYKKLGKDPNRYRPSAEALLRRIVKNNELYQISTLVDIINLVSLKTGYSIGGFDQQKIEGDISLGIGKPDEPYQGIGRGTLNIENLPVYRDQKGGIGTPTSDHIRTSIGLDTKHILMVVNDFSGQPHHLEETLEMIKTLLAKYVSGENIEVTII